MNKYQLVSDRKAEEPAQDNEIRITKNGIIGKYISYAFRLIQDENKSLVIKAMGQTIHRAIIVAEILKRRIPGLHQINELGSVEVVDIYEPIEEGLEQVKLTRHIPSINITLSTQPLDSKHKGYQAPLSAELFAQNNAARERGGRRGNRRGGPRFDSRRDEQTESKEGGNSEKGKGRENGPRGSDNRPRGRENGPRGSDNRPRRRENGPRGNENGPRRSDNGPRGRGNGSRRARGRGRGDGRRRSERERTNSNRQGARNYTPTKNQTISNISVTGGVSK